MFRVFVVKNKIRHNFTAQKHENLISNFYFQRSVNADDILNLIYPEDL